VAWLYDVNDSKYYDKLIEDEINKFLNKMKIKYKYPCHFTSNILMTIEHISYSKEKYN